MNSYADAVICASTSISPLPGLVLSYRLVRIGRLFYLDVTAADGKGKRSLRSGAIKHRASAERFFEIAVHHAVTPYTLDAVLDDLHDSL